MEHLTIPQGYVSPLTIRETEVAIKEIKDYFERSLAKWKRYALKHYGFHSGEGLYTDMSAIRRDEDTDNIHSIYVDQWDWEKVISKEERNMETLQYTVRKVYSALKETEDYISRRYNYIEPLLPDDIFFITSQELEDLYPDLTPKHDGRAPDYDDWELNGDIIVYYPVLDIALELSSMGIRVDEEALAKQLKLSGCEDRAKLPFQKSLLNRELPYTIGGGIGQSRICMYYLRKAHIGEVQSSLWPDDIYNCALEHGIQLL